MAERSRSPPAQAAQWLIRAADEAAEALLAGLERVEVLCVRATCPHLSRSGATRIPLLTVIVAALAEDPIGKKREAVLRALAALAAGGNARVAEFALSSLPDRVPDVRRAAVASLAAVAPGLDAELARVALLCLGPALRDHDQRVSAAAAKALPLLVQGRGNVTAVAVAFKHLSHTSALVRISALDALKKVALRGDGAVVAAVVHLAQKDGDWRVRTAALRGLPQVAERGDPSALAALAQGMRDEHAHCRTMSAGAMAHLAANPSQPFLAAAHARREAHERKVLRQKRAASKAATPHQLEARAATAATAKRVRCP